MKLADHVEQIRQLIDKAFRNRLGRMGINASGLQPVDIIPGEYRSERKRIGGIREVLIAETGTAADAYEKLVEEFTFTLFNRLAALKVMEAHALHPEIVTRQPQYGDRSFAHFLWLEQNPDGRGEEQDGLVRFMEAQLASLVTDIPLFSPKHPYHLLPTAIELNGIINAFNQLETDTQVESDIWKSDDVLGWLYESYSNYKKAAHKESKAKTEYNKVSIQSQVYTPRWVVKFLVDNSLGKLYLEMYPDSAIKEKYKIANAPKTQTRERKRLTEIRLIDPATGSGNFLLYGFDLFYDLYTDQIENYGADYDENKIPELIIQYNLHGIDLDDRAVQLAQLGLYIKAKRIKRSTKIDKFNIVSSDFFLPEYNEVKHLFENGEPLSHELENIVTDLWADLQQAFKFGSLIRLEEKFSMRLHRLVDQETKGITLFTESTLADYQLFRENFFVNLQKAVAHNAEKQGLTFLSTKTGDAISFLQLLTQKYDVAVANPPYTDSVDFGLELKSFIDSNYKQLFKFNSNLYAAFIKRCCEIVDDTGKVALVHPQTFMYIKTFEDVRKYLLEKMHINLFVEWGYLGMFNPLARVDSVMYVLEKTKAVSLTTFIKLDDLYEGKRYNAFFEAYDNLLTNHPNKHTYSIAQSKLRIIDGWPFIYWISDGFRDKFKGHSFVDYVDNCQGLATSDNNQFVRYWWEVGKNNIYTLNQRTNKKWFLYSKGGPFEKWYGNQWAIVNYENNGAMIRQLCNRKYSHIKGYQEKWVVKNENYYFKEGITYSALGGTGMSFRYLQPNSIFDVGGSSIFLRSEEISLNYCLALLNTKLVVYFTACLNPTVNTQVGDLKRIPFIKPDKILENSISNIAAQNIQIKKELCTFRVIEINFEKNPLSLFFDFNLRDSLLYYLNYENAKLTAILINEAIVNELIFEIYELSPEDRLQVENQMGKSVGGLPVFAAAREAFLLSNIIENETVKEFIENLVTTTFEEQLIQSIKAEFSSFYQSNNNLEEFCSRHRLNPINVWFWFQESKVLPQARSSVISLEFLTDAFRTILMEDEDGIIPLVGLPGEPRLLDRLELECLNQGFTTAQFMQLDGLLGHPVNDYIEHHYFKNLSDYLNLFLFLPKTPFIWHLSSGEHQGFEAYIIIYKWNRDSLFKLKTQYLSKRAESLEYRHLQLQGSQTAQAQNEREKIRLQLEEIKLFTEKLDELIAEGYEPKLDDGVGKNIAPLQQKGLLRCDVLNKKQLDKYLNADW